MTCMEWIPPRSFPRYWELRSCRAPPWSGCLSGSVAAPEVVEALDLLSLVLGVAGLSGSADSPWCRLSWASSFSVSSGFSDSSLVFPFVKLNFLLWSLL